jgi:hypothetical protein
MHGLVTYPRALVKGVDGTLRSRSRRLFSTDAGEGRGGACGGKGEGSGGAATGSGLAAATAAGSATTAAAVPVPVICVRAGCAGSCAGGDRGGGRSNGGSCWVAAASSWVKYTTEEEGREDSVAGCGPAPGGSCGRRGVPLVRPARSVAARRADLRTSRGEVPLVASRATSAAPSSRRRRSLDAMGKAEGGEAGTRGVEGPWTKKRARMRAGGRRGESETRATSPLGVGPLVNITLWASAYVGSSLGPASHQWFIFFPSTSHY